MGWVALGVLVLGLVVAALLLAPWHLKFAADPRELYDQLYEQAGGEATDAFGWLASAGFGYQDLRNGNTAKVRRMLQLSGALAALMVIQTLSWLVALAVE
jgi:hypothetical protein